MGSGQKSAPFDFCVFFIGTFEGGCSRDELSVSKWRAGSNPINNQSLDMPRNPLH